MVLSMLMKMTSNGDCIKLLDYCLCFYKSADHVAWRATSARICRALLLDCSPTHHNATISHFDGLQSLLFNCSNGSLIQNEKLIFDALSSIHEALNSQLCSSKLGCPLLFL